MELNTTNPYCFTYQTDELLIELLGGVRIDGLDRMMIHKTRILSSTSTTHPQLRMRIFAGPNGSGKSAIINSVKNEKVGGGMISEKPKPSMQKGSNSSYITPHVRGVFYFS